MRNQRERTRGHEGERTSWRKSNEREGKTDEKKNKKRTLGTLI